VLLFHVLRPFISQASQGPAARKDWRPHWPAQPLLGKQPVEHPSWPTGAVAAVEDTDSFQQFPHKPPTRHHPTQQPSGVIVTFIPPLDQG
jgi:hypothetical protein